MKTVYDIARDAGLSTSPSYYSGRGATTSDLNGMHLDKIYESIRFHIGQPAATQFAIMVAEIPVLSATDFLLTLFRLAGNDWVWSKDFLPQTNGISIDSQGSAFGTIMSVWSKDFLPQTNGISIDSQGSAFGTIMSVFGGNRHDQTSTIRSSFLYNHKKEIPKASMPQPKNDGWPDSYFGY